MESSASPEFEAICSKVAEVCQALGACAAGYWRRDQASAQLLQVAFVPGPGLDPRVGSEFAKATLVVPLSQQSLGIVIAALSGQPAISRVGELPPDAGSGIWLRAFGASRSVAVPAFDEAQAVCGVMSVALPDDIKLDNESVASELRQAMK